MLRAVLTDVATGERCFRQQRTEADGSRTVVVLAIFVIAATLFGAANRTTKWKVRIDAPLEGRR
jgi:uncharacterized membrane protein